MEISLFLLRRLLGVKTEDKKQTKVSKLVKNELLLINIGSTSTGGRVLSVKAELAKIQLTSPACTEVGEKVALSRRIEKHWRLVGKHPLVEIWIDHYYKLLTLLFFPLRMGQCTAGYCDRSRLDMYLSFDCNHFSSYVSRDSHAHELKTRYHLQTINLLGCMWVLSGYRLLYSQGQVASIDVLRVY